MSRVDLNYKFVGINYMNIISKIQKPTIFIFLVVLSNDGEAEVGPADQKKKKKKSFDRGS